MCGARAVLGQGMAWECCGGNEFQRVNGGLGAPPGAKTRWEFHEVALGERGSVARLAWAEGGLRWAESVPSVV